jgi:hypothetical protein
MRRPVHNVATVRHEELAGVSSAVPGRDGASKAEPGAEPMIVERRAKMDGVRLVATALLGAALRNLDHRLRRGPKPNGV